MTNPYDPNAPEHDEHGVTWHPAEGPYSPPDIVPHEPSPHSLDDLRAAVSRGERLTLTVHEIAFDADGTPAAVRAQHYDEVFIMDERGDKR